VHGLRCYGNITRTQNVSEYMLVLALCLVLFVYEISRELLNGFTPHGKRVWFLARTTLEAKVKGQRSRPPGTKRHFWSFRQAARGLRLVKHL